MWRCYSACSSNIVARGNRLRRGRKGSWFRSTAVQALSFIRQWMAPWRCRVGTREAHESTFRALVDMWCRLVNGWLVYWCSGVVPLVFTHNNYNSAFYRWIVLRLLFYYRKLFLLRKIGLRINECGECYFNDALYQLTLYHENVHF